MYSQTKAQETFLLYPQGAPGLVAQNTLEKSTTEGGVTRVSDVIEPSVSVYKPTVKTSDAVVLICPGGGYHILAIDHEGYDIAKWFNDKGVTAVVLKYRLPTDRLYSKKEIRPLEDVQTALVWIRENAKKLDINPDKVGLMGFSAGGHLAATGSTWFNKPVISKPKESVRPDFSILIYPVISFSDSLMHEGSRANLIGKNPSKEMIEAYSPDLQVTKETPPAFLVSTSDDFVKVENSISYYLACKKYDVPAQLHIYPKGGHGYALKKRNLGLVETWPDRLEEWLIANGWM